jgi:hypothetical protein
MQFGRSVQHPVIPIGIVIIGVAILVSVVSIVERHAFAIGAIGSVEFTVNTTAAALAATLGILMALVLLTVQLTAQRFTFNIVDIVLPSPINMGIILLYVVSIVSSLWISVVISDDYIPVVGTFVALGLATLCFALLIPYMLFLFKVLHPSNLLTTFRKEVIEAARAASNSGDISANHARAAERIENIGDVGRSAVNLADADTARRQSGHCTGTLHDYLEIKRSLPTE